MANGSGNGRNGDRKFAPGNTIGPGRPPGWRTALARTLDEIPADDVKALRDKLVSLAKDGDMAAARIILDRKGPTPKGAPVEFELGAVEKPEDISKAPRTAAPARTASPPRLDPHLDSRPLRSRMLSNVHEC